MIWTDDDLDAAREMQRKKLEYAKELEEQIELRRAVQREEQHELEELERKFQPDDRSPAKWLVDGGHSAPGANAYRSAFRFPISQSHAQQEMQYFGDQAAYDRAAPATSPLPSAGEPSAGPSAERDNASSQHTRFRITDLQDQSDRLRERAQQLEWKRILDEQVRENARLKEQEELARRREDAGQAREEMMYMRDLQLRAQRRMGLPEIASEPSPVYGRATPQRQYETFATHERPSPGAAYQQQHQQEQQRVYELPQHADYGHRFSDPHHTGRSLYDTDAVAMPPPAPTRLDYAAANVVGLTREPVAPSAMYPQHQQQAQQQPPQLNRQAHDAFDGSRSVLINEYRSLLTEIRREREELRQEKDEVRKEKEALQLERALLQLENEKMASLIETQRRLNEQQLEMQRREPLRQTQQQQQQQYHPPLSSAPSPAREYYAPAQSVQRPQRPLAFDFSQLHHAEQSIAALELESRGARETRAAMTPDRRPSPMSMADFATPQNRLTPNVVDSPRLKRLSHVRRQSAAAVEARNAPTGVSGDDGERSALDESLIGESVFVALRPDEVASAASRGPPRITETASPRRDERRLSSERDSELRSSRVIKSRGFYNFESEAGAFPTRERKSAKNSKSQRRPSDAHKSPVRSAHSVEKTRFPQSAAAAAREYGDSGNARLAALSSASSDDDRDRSARHLARRHGVHEHRDDGGAGAALSTSSHERDADDSRDGDAQEDERELSRSLFQVKVLV